MSKVEKDIYDRYAEYCPRCMANNLKIKLVLEQQPMIFISHISWLICPRCGWDNRYEGIPNWLVITLKLAPYAIAILIIIYLFPILIQQIGVLK